MLACPCDAIGQTNAPCREDIRALCANLEPGHGAMQRCLQEHLGDLSSGCRAHLQRGVERALTPARPDHTRAGRAKNTGE
jgi:Cysteine rich repeat